MKSGQQVMTLWLAVIALATAAVAQAPAQGDKGAAQKPAVSPSVWAAPPAPQAQASSAFQSACGNQPLCYDTPNFAAAVVDFRMSVKNGVKVMDATVRFVNKSNQPLILGYVDNSAVGLDDQGNRYGTYYNTGLAGMGVVAGNNIDPKFMLQPGSAGDARYELMWRPGAQDPISSTFEVDMTIREVNTLAGGQHTLGGEYPLRFQGLVNGVTGSSMAAAGTPAAGASGASQMLATGGGAVPCAPGGSAANTMTNVATAANSVGGQRAGNATSTATNRASNAMAQFAGLKSLFGKKNAAAAPAPTANLGGGTPCVPTATGSTAVAAGASAVPARSSPTAGVVPTAAATPAAIGARTSSVAPNAAPAAAKPSAARSANIANSVVPASQTTNTAAKKSATTTAATAKKPAATTTATSPTK